MTLEEELVADTKRTACQLCSLLSTIPAESVAAWRDALAKPGTVIGHEAVARRLQTDFGKTLTTAVIKNHRRHA